MTWPLSPSTRMQYLVSLAWLILCFIFLSLPIVLGLAFHPLRVHLTPAYVEYKGEKSALVPGGIRIGSPAMTTRGFTERVFVAIADFIHEGVEITLDAKRSASGSKLLDFMKFVTSQGAELKLLQPSSPCPDLRHLVCKHKF